MGLDMYLYKHTYIGNKYREPNERIGIRVPRNQEKSMFPLPARKIKKERISYIVEEVMYWRKANQIHNWFVENVQDGEDDCKEYYVEQSKLEELIDLCDQVLAYLDTCKKTIKIVEDFFTKKPFEYWTYDFDPKVINELLPAVSGFFFGSTEIDMHYYNDIKETSEKLKKLLKEGDTDDFYYRSSW